MLDALLFVLAAPLAAQTPAKARLEVISLPSVTVRGASSDGLWLTGSHDRVHNWPLPFRWSQATGLDGLEPVTYEGLAISDDGEFVLTRVVNFSHYNQFQFTAAVRTPSGLKVFPGVGQILHTSPAEGLGMSRDGRFVAGSGIPDNIYKYEPETAWLWELGGPVTALKSDWPGATRAYDVSDDGRVVVGLARRPTTIPISLDVPVLWREQEVEVLAHGIGAAYGTNADGSFVTGELGGRPFLWSPARGLRLLETVDPIQSGGLDWFRGKQVSDDGSTVLTRQVVDFWFWDPFESVAHLWREGAGAVVPSELLRALGAEFPPDMPILGNTVSMGSDGRTLVGSGSTSGHPKAPILLWRAVLPPAAEPYCTAQTSAAGCAAELRFQGTPSARTGAGFTISADDVPAGAQALLAYGTSGAADVPFGGGVLCVAEPTTRVALASAGGDEGCEGVLSIDFNAVVAQASDPALVGGAHVWAQLWIRDAEAPPPQLLLSDALVFTLWP